jgi:hypothetical protein
MQNNMNNYRKDYNFTDKLKTNKFLKITAYYQEHNSWNN